MKMVKKIKNPFSCKTDHEVLYLKEKDADVLFIFGANKDRVPGHKSLLAKLSPVFKAQFFGPMAEKDEVTIEDKGLFIMFICASYLKLYFSILENIS